MTLWLTADRKVLSPQVCITKANRPKVEAGNI